MVTTDFRRQVKDHTQFVSCRNLSDEETTHAAMGMKGDAGGHLHVVQGVCPLPGVQGHQAHRLQSPEDPSALQMVHRGEPRHCGAPAPLTGVPLPADHDRQEHQVAGRRHCF